MRRMIAGILSTVLIAGSLHAQTLSQLAAHNVTLRAVEFKGKPAIEISEQGEVANGEAYAIVKETTFHNGTIDVDLAGSPVEGTPSAARVASLASAFV